MAHSELSKPSVPSDTDVASEDESQMDDSSLKGWLERRLRWGGFIRDNLDEPMPPGVGWWQTLGSLLLALLGLQTITGIALAMYYAPTPDHAYSSVQYISRDVPLGGFVRGIHHWGASVIVVAMVLHLLRVFFWGSYKKPREITWLSGVVIFQLMLGFAFTGYLLPWDQKAYWATVVGSNIAGTIPVIGNYICTVMRGGSIVGAMTLSRFYAIHVLVLPLVLLGLVSVHLFQVRLHHTAGPVTPRKGVSVPFYPVQLFRDAVVAMIATGILVSLALFAAPKLAGVANPFGVDFAPRPEWYYLGLFEMLKLIPPKLEVMGTVLIPGLVTIGMFALPWLDRSVSRHPSDRRSIIDIGMLIIFAIGLLTLKGVLSN
jgi:ubiquinol-cytochrome c reductase cytochrome b subunit